MKRVLILMGLCVSLINTSCQDKKEEKEVLSKLLVTSPLMKDTTIIKDYVSQIHAIQHIEIRALEKGYLQKIFVDEGQMVKKGQIMFQIMPMMYEAEMHKSQAEADFAKTEYLNAKLLADSNIISKNQLALVRAKYDKAKAELSLSQVRLGFTQIKAPFDGIMDRFQVRLGSLVDEGDLLTTLSDNSKLWVYFNVPEAEYLNFKTVDQSDNMKNVRLLMANNELYENPGVVETIEADFNNETGNIAFRATFPNPKGLLRHGETGSIQMVVPLKHALIIPQKATYEILEKKYVFVVDKNSVVHTREIQIRSEMPDLYVIKGGLKPEEKILLEGIRKVKDGDKITYKYQEPNSVISNLKVYTE
ncbi:efflux RND transporter periplasmic adaptor subunit [Fluviicola taffensis]|uniref:Efflux transporter, RND family, MFP subunit n=1 Tax=Fluviicola taffensis (strain DSM 16823 / NCIMB 13979 / RW262) TaxID=755732 RepID=F2IB62_FLUTR|nr:efflux RND transporter periplasmic adaptor subunit [Fluviicola taffensis]AEA42145.1 efflux transporter, RND family, MFP subunit [Fluviicola taffensis DSM 16823]